MAAIFGVWTFPENFITPPPLGTYDVNIVSIGDFNTITQVVIQGNIVIGINHKTNGYTQTAWIGNDSGFTYPQYRVWDFGDSQVIDDVLYEWIFANAQSSESTEPDVKPIYRYMIVNAEQLEADLASVADSIRAKSGTSDKLAFPSGFKSAVDGIAKSEIKNQDITIKENGTYTPDSGFTGFGSVTVEVASSGDGEIVLPPGVGIYYIGTASSTMSQPSFETSASGVRLEEE